MDDKYDTYKTTNIKINKLIFFERLINYLLFLNIIILVKNTSLTALHRIRSPISTFVNDGFSNLNSWYSSLMNFFNSLLVVKCYVSYTLKYSAAIIICVRVHAYR
jgi:hypothetical protein